MLLLSPPPISEAGILGEMFEGGREKSLKLGEYYKAVSEEMECSYMDTSSVVKCSSIDGIHLEAEEHMKLGKAVAKVVRELLI